MTPDEGNPPLTLADCVFRLKASSVSAFVGCDPNDDGRMNVSDGIYTVNHLFTGGPRPPAPFPECGRVDVPVEECPPGSTRCR